MEVEGKVPLLSSHESVGSKQEDPENEELLNQTGTVTLPNEYKEHYSSSLFDPEISWEERKSLALKDLNKEENRNEHNIHWLAYNQQSLLISNEIESFQFRLKVAKEKGPVSTESLLTVHNLLKKNRFELSPIIYSIWGEIDLANKAKDSNEKDFLINSQINAEEPTDELGVTIILIRYLKKFMRQIAKSRVSRLYGSKKRLVFNEDLAVSGLFEYELAHIFKHHNITDLDLTNVLHQDNTISLRYLIESEDETLINDLSIENDSDSPLSFCIKNKYTGCTELLTKYVIELLKDNPKRIAIKSKVEEEFKNILISSSSLIPLLIEPMLVSVKKIQFRSDVDDLPMMVFTNIEDIETVMENDFRENEYSENINAQLLRSSIKLPSQSGSASSLTLITSLHFCQNPMIFRVPLIKYYLDAKWEFLWMYVFLQTLLTWVNIPLLVLILSDSYNQEICVILFISVNSLLLLIEIIQIVSLGLFGYLGDINKLAAYYLLKLCLIIVMYQFYHNIILLLFSSCAAMLAIYFQTDLENRYHASSIEVMAVIIGISIVTGWGWWIYLILTFVFGATICGISVLELSDKSGAIVLAILHGIIAFVSLFVWLEWDTLYFMIPLGAAISALFGLFAAKSEVKEDLPYMILISSAIRMTIAMLFCIFSYNNLSIAIMLLFFNSAEVIGGIVSLCHTKTVDNYVKLANEIGNCLTSLCILLLFSDMIEIFKAGLFIIPLVTFLYDYKKVLRLMKSDEKEIFYVIKLIPILILFQANFQSYSEVLLSILVITVINIFTEITVTERFPNTLLKNIFKITFNWNTIDIARLSFCGVWVYYYFNNEEAPIFVAYLLAAFTLLRGITGFRCFSGTRYYVRLVFDSAANIKDFLFLFFYVTLAFGVLTNLSQSESIAFQAIWINSYSLNLGSFGEFQEINISYLIFFFATIINVIIMLNLLISILGDSFDKFQISAAEIDYMEMVDVIKEIETVMIWKRHRTDKGYLIVLDLFRDQGGSDESKWEGKISKISKDIRYEISPLKIELKELKEIMNSRVENHQNENNMSLKQEISDQIEPFKNEVKELIQNENMNLKKEINDQKELIQIENTNLRQEIRELKEFIQDLFKSHVISKDSEISEE